MNKLSGVVDNMNDNINTGYYKIESYKKPIEIHIKPTRKYITTKQWNEAIYLKDFWRDECFSNTFCALPFMEKVIKLKGFVAGCLVEFGKVNKATFKRMDFNIIYKITILENYKRIKIIITW